MKSQQGSIQLKSDLETLGAEIQKRRQPGSILALPDELKVRVLQLHQAGVSCGEIRRVTGVQSKSLKAWAKNMSPAPTQRSFRVVKLSDERPETPAPMTLTFRFASGRVTVDVAVAALSPELLRVLTSC
jgi:hypothetical protein